MALKQYNPTSPGQRQLVLVDRSELHKGRPEKSLVEGLTSKGGRNNAGRVTVRFRGGGAKKLYRIVDFKRRKFDVAGTVVAVGPGRLLDNGQRGELSVQVGDEVIYGKYGGTDIKLNGDEVKILRESDILAKVVG